MPLWPSLLILALVHQQRSVFVLWVHAHFCYAGSLHSVCVRLATRMQSAQQGARGRRPFGARGRRPFGAPFAYPLSLTLCARVSAVGTNSNTDRPQTRPPGVLS